MALLPAALAGAPTLAWDNSAIIAQQQRDAARLAQERSMQDMLAAQRQADMLQAHRLSQMRQDNPLNDQRQAELRRSAERVYGLDKPVSMPTTTTSTATTTATSTATAAAPNSPNPAAATAADGASQRAAATPAFPAQSVWADLPNQRIMSLRPDGSFSLVFPKDGQFVKAVGRYQVDGQRIQFTTGQTVEHFAWALGSVVGRNGQPLGHFQLSNGQVYWSWVACASCTQWSASALPRPGAGGRIHWPSPRADRPAR